MPDKKKSPKTGKRRAKRRNSDYRPVFTDAEHKLMQDYGIGSLLDEIGVNRIMLARVLDKMNGVMDQLTFRDYLDALRATSYATGRIAGLLELREKLYKPYQQVEEQYRRYFEAVQDVFDEMGAGLYGQEKWDAMQWNVLRQSMGLSPINIEEDGDDQFESGQ